MEDEVVPLIESKIKNIKFINRKLMKNNSINTYHNLSI